MEAKCRTEELIEELREVQALIKKANIEYNQIYESRYLCAFTAISTNLWDVIKGARPWDFLKDRNFRREAKDLGNFLINLENNYLEMEKLEKTIDELHNRQYDIKNELGID